MARGAEISQRVAKVGMTAGSSHAARAPVGHQRQGGAQCGVRTFGTAGGGEAAKQGAGAGHAQAQRQRATTDSRLLPLLALASSRSIRVTVFIAVNCIELTAPSEPQLDRQHGIGRLLVSQPKAGQQQAQQQGIAGQDDAVASVRSAAWQGIWPPLPPPPARSCSCRPGPANSQCDLQQQWHQEWQGAAAQALPEQVAQDTNGEGAHAEQAGREQRLGVARPARSR